MTLLPGFKRGSTTATLSEIVQDQSFSESMKQLNQDSNHFQWDLNQLKIQRETPKEISVIYHQLPLTTTVQPSWSLNFEGDIQDKLYQELNINASEGIAQHPVYGSMPITMSEYQRSSLLSTSDVSSDNTHEYNAYISHQDVSLNNARELDDTLLIYPNQIYLRDEMNRYTNHIRNDGIWIKTRRVTTTTDYSEPIQLLVKGFQEDQQYLLSDDRNRDYLFDGTLTAHVFSTSWKFNSVFEISGTSQQLYLNNILLNVTASGYKDQNIDIPRTVFKIDFEYPSSEEYTGIFLDNTYLNVSNCYNLISISAIDPTSTGTIYLNSTQMSRFQDRITEEDDVKLFDGVLTVQERK